MAPGLKSVTLGLVSYAALVPTALWGKRKKMTLREFFSELPLATQTTDGQFSAQLREIAKTLEVGLAPALACQSFPQTMAAVKSGRFAAIVPELSLRDFSPGSVHRVHAGELTLLAREAMLVWNPRLVRIRPNASKIAARLHHVLAIQTKTESPA